MSQTFSFDDSDDRRRFAAGVLLRLESAGEGSPMEEKPRYDRSLWDDYRAAQTASPWVAVAASAALVAFSVFLWVRHDFEMTSGLICVALAIILPAFPYLFDRSLARSRNRRAANALSRAKVTGSEFEILREIHENFGEDYYAGIVRARRESSLRRIQNVPSYREL